jgi:hypothetical protein
MLLQKPIRKLECFQVEKIYCTNRLAEEIVLDNNIVTVIGPTPPGTGVILAATCLTFAKSTSPTRRYPVFLVSSVTGFVPTSITMAPSFTHSFLTLQGLTFDFEIHKPIQVFRQRR